MSVSDPDLYDRKAVELTPTVALTQLIPRGVRERGDQFPTFSNVVEERDNPWIKASVILEPGHLIAHHADGFRPPLKREARRQCRSVFI